MILERTTDPAAAAVSDALGEAQLALAPGEGATLLAQAIAFGTDSVERDTDRALIDQTWTMHLDKFPNGETIYIPKGKVNSVTSLKYLDSDGNLQTLVDGTDYRITTVGSLQRIIPIDSWPETTTDKLDAVQLIWVAGYGADESSVPEWAKQAILLKCQQSYDGTDVTDAYGMHISSRQLFFDYANYNK